MKRLAAFLGFLCLVLLLLAFDEGQMKRGVEGAREHVGPVVARVGPTVARGAEAVRARIGPAVDKLGETLQRLPMPRPDEGATTTAEPAGSVVAADQGTVRFQGAVLQFEAAPAMRTRPHRIAYGRDSLARPLRLPPTHQIELRQVVPVDARTPVAASPLCLGQAPGWVGLARRGRTVQLLVWRAGPPPDQPGASLCGQFRFDGSGR